MTKWVPSRAGLTLIFLLLGLLVLVFDRATYKRYSSGEFDFTARDGALGAATAVQTTLKELASKLDKVKVAPAGYEVVGDKNLFAPERQAWQPPAPAPADVKPGDAVPVPVPAPERRDVILYGTYLAGANRKALLDFKRFRDGKRLLAEGREARDEESGRSPAPAYTLLKVEARKVVLKDERGAEFEVGLYDNKQRRPLTTANQANIQVEAAEVAPVAVSATGGAVSGGGAAAKPVLSAGDIRKLSIEEKDNLVKQGELIKHSTPFGPVYKRPAGK
ncbi:MAG: hypothetical protein JXR89_01630 [Deltaproteobacteria bacterium]|nr:hypothetical protein [Deltaproteobacteria bacterium]